MAGVDALLNASVNAVKKSGALEGNALMATVSVVNSNGTVDCTRAGDTFPSVRVLSGYQVPTVGDSVELLRSAGGWLCVGKLMTTHAPQIARGTVNVSISAATSGSTTVTFARPFPVIPTVVGSLATGDGTARYFTARAYGATTTGFSALVLSSDAAQAAITGSFPVAWIATTF